MFDGSCCVFKNKANITSLLVIEEIAGLKCFYIDFTFRIWKLIYLCFLLYSECYTA